MGDETNIIKRAIGEGTPLTIGLVVTMLGFAFWMGIQHSELSTLNTNVRDVLKDHESRIRVLEKRP